MEEKNIMIEEPKGIIDNTDNKTVYYHNFVKHSFSKCYQNSNGEKMLIQFYSPSKIEKDSRQKICTIIHFKENSSHEVKVCIDLKNHQVKQPFHLNVSGETKNNKIFEKCKTCKNYFSFINHHPILFNNGTEKIVNFDRSWEEIEKNLYKNDFFKDFKKELYNTNRNIGGEIKCQKK